MGHERKVQPGTPDTPERKEAAGQVGPMTPIDPGVGPGGTTTGASHSDDASGGARSTEWGGGMVTAPRVVNQAREGDDIEGDATPRG